MTVTSKILVDEIEYYKPELLNEYFSEVRDKINLKDINKVKSVFILSNQTSIYNVMSNIYNKSQLFPPIKIKKDKDLNIIRYTREVWKKK